VTALPESLAEQDIAGGSLIGDHFRVVRKLGFGGMGEIYLAENLNLPDKRYAIKVLRQDLSQIGRYAELLAGEAQKQSRLEHDNIVQIYDFLRWQHRYCLIMAFVDGTTLADMIDAEPGGLAEGRALDLVTEVLRALNHAHERGVLHCDVKPANVLVDREQRVRVTDFGIARDIGLADSNTELGVVGTPEYMSPEQATDPDHVDHRADIYAVGVLLFELLTGRLPFVHERADGNVRFPQLTDAQADLRAYRKDLSPMLARIVATALQRERSSRFQGCLEFLRAIAAYQRQQRWRRTWLPAIGVAAVVAVVATLGGYQWQQQVRARAAAATLEAERVAREQRIANEANAREAIQASVATAIKQLGSMCRESLRLQARQAALVTANQAGFQDLEAKFKQQIGEMHKNLSDYALGYAQSVAQMAKFESGWVGESIAAHPHADAESGRLVDALRADYAALVAQRAMRGSAELLAGCPR
jgi:tRNA A-37 threonylcarbamoyl transferase component Bud32